ncbi:MAG: hypothetical protein ABI229_07710 [Gemmatimonadaceae bacterium]
MATVSALRDLRELLDLKFPDAAPLQRLGTEVVATGIGGLDGIFPSGGFPRGRLSIWAPGGGATAVLRSACRSAVAGGERAVWIDGGGTMAGAFWDAGPILVRPRSRLHALRAAEALLRSGGFAVVVLAGADPQGTENVRLSRAAHDGGGACIALTASATTSALRASSSIRPHGYVWRRDPHGDAAAIDTATLEVRVSSLGWNRRARVVLPVCRDESRLALSIDLPDRRGTR